MPPTFEKLRQTAVNRVRRLDLSKLIQAGIYLEPFSYYLMGTYPPIKAMSPISPDEVFSGASRDSSIYIHVPFCEQYCTFCHFTKEINPRQARVDVYLEALLAEMDLVTDALGGSLSAHDIYFGGGTPSYLRPDRISRVFAKLHSRARMTSDCEITFELHPGMVRNRDHLDRIAALKECGVNRWVFGVQSMEDQILRKLNRGHSSAEVVQLIRALRHEGCDPLSVDLIFGCPGQSLESWHETLSQLVEEGVDKFNIFPLMFKLSDPISRHYLRDPSIFPNGELRLLMHFFAEAFLAEHGFRRPLAFYYSKSEIHSVQQRTKFEDFDEVDLVPIGVSGFGYVGATQYFNHCSMGGYMDMVRSARPPVWLGHTLSREEEMRRTVMFELRGRGVNCDRFLQRFGVEPRVQFAREVTRLCELGLVEERDGYLQATDDGIAFIDGIGGLFASRAVREAAQRTTDGITDPQRDLLEIHDFSPLERSNSRTVEQSFDGPP